MISKEDAIKYKEFILDCGAATHKKHRRECDWYEGIKFRKKKLCTCPFANTDHPNGCPFEYVYDKAQDIIVEHFDVFMDSVL